MPSPTQCLTPRTVGFLHPERSCSTGLITKMLFFSGFVSSPWTHRVHWVLWCYSFLTLFLNLFFPFGGFQVQRPPGPPYTAHEISKGHPNLAATPPGHASSPGLSQVSVSTVSTAHLYGHPKAWEAGGGVSAPMQLPDRMCVCICVCLHCLLRRALYSIISCCLNISLPVLAALKSRFGIKSATKQMSHRNFHRACSDAPSLMSHRCSLRESSTLKSLFIKINH